jgi:chloramphenicol 3-O phosphotransferase
MTPGNIVLLNGTSSSGKSTLAKALQQLLGPRYFHLDLDLFQKTWHPNFLVYSDGENPASAEGLLAVFRNDALREIRIGPGGFRFMDGLFRAVAGWASAGDNLIVEGAIYDPQVLRSAVAALHRFPILFVGIRCPLEVAEQWEQIRGDRARGGARTFHDLVHTHGVYDLEVDTSLAPPKESAHIIKTAIDGNHPQTAFRQLAVTMNIQ